MGGIIEYGHYKGFVGDEPVKVKIIQKRIKKGKPVMLEISRRMDAQSGFWILPSQLITDENKG